MEEDRLWMLLPLLKPQLRGQKLATGLLAVSWDTLIIIEASVVCVTRG